MKARDLIIKLQTLDPETEIKIDYYDKYKSITHIRKIGGNITLQHYTREDIKELLSCVSAKIMKPLVFV